MSSRAELKLSVDIAEVGVLEVSQSEVLVTEVRKEALLQRLVSSLKTLLAIPNMSENADTRTGIETVPIVPHRDEAMAVLGVSASSKKHVLVLAPHKRLADQCKAEFSGNREYVAHVHSYQHLTHAEKLIVLRNMVSFGRLKAVVLVIEEPENVPHEVQENWRHLRSIANQTVDLTICTVSSDGEFELAIPTWSLSSSEELAFPAPTQYDTDRSKPEAPPDSPDGYG